jgi:hypothetical protein
VVSSIEVLPSLMGPQLNATRWADLKTALAVERPSSETETRVETAPLEQPVRGEPTRPRAPRSLAEHPRGLPEGRGGSERAGVGRSSGGVVPGGGSKTMALWLTGWLRPGSGRLGTSSDASRVRELVAKLGSCGRPPATEGSRWRVGFQDKGVVGTRGGRPSMSIFERAWLARMACRLWEP